MDGTAQPWVGRTISHYEVLEKVGGGGMGVVYKARDLRLGRVVALKFLHSHADSPEDRRRFLHEARTASSLDHPNICTVYEVDETGDGKIFFAMNYCEGETLKEKIRCGPLRLGEAIDYAIQACAGLGRAHAQGVVHRDIKPPNLIVGRDGRLKIVDFGIARLVNESRLTRPGFRIGTAAYMSPEQILGETVDHRSDIWALGVILYEMVTGRLPFPSDERALAYAILHRSPEPLTALRAEAPAELERIVAKAMAKDPADRYQHVDEIPVDLRAVQRSSSRPMAVTGETQVEIPRASAERRSPPAPRKRLFWAAALAAGIGLGLVAGFAAPHQIGLPPFGPREEAVPSFELLTYERGTIQRARFAPDGQTILFGASWNGKPYRLFLTRHGSRLSSPIDLPPADLLAVSSTGELAISLDHKLGNLHIYGRGTLARAPLLGGGARKLQEDISDADWTPDASGLALVRRSGTSEQLEFPIGKVLHRAGGHITRIRFSRDGKRIAFFEHPGMGDWAGSVSVLELATGKVATLSEGWNALLGLAWSPSGDEIWFSGRRGWNVTLSAVGLDGRLRTLLPMPAEVALLDVSPAGQALMARQDRIDQTFVARSDGSPERDVSWLSGSFPVDISDDGKTLLLAHRGEGSGPSHSVYLQNLDEPSTTLLGEGVAQAISPDGHWIAALIHGMPTRLLLLPAGPGQTRSLEIPLRVFSAGWFPDGRHLVLTASAPGRPKRCYLFDLTRGATRALTPEDTDCSIGKTAVSPDGKYVLAANQQSGALFPVDGGPPRQLPSTSGACLRWDASGKTLFIMKRSDLTSGRLWQVYKMDVKTGEQRLWKEIRPADPTGVGMQRTVMAPDGQTYAYTLRHTLSHLFLVEGLN